MPSSPSNPDHDVADPDEDVADPDELTDAPAAGVLDDDLEDPPEPGEPG